MEVTRHLKIAPAVGVVLLLISAVARGALLGPDLNRRTTDVMRSVQLAVGDELMEETVDVDQEKGTEIFRTVSSTGTSFVMMDVKNGLSAYRFDGDEKCYILDSGLEDAEDTAELSEDLGQIQEGEVDPAERLSETFLSVGGEGGQVEPSELSESVAEFCEGLQAYRADKSSTRPSPTPEESAEEEGLPERNVPQQGSNAEQGLEKRFFGLLHKLFRKPSCHFVTKNVCSRKCHKVCGKRRRRGLVDGEPEKRFFGLVHHLLNKVTGCKSVCNNSCSPVKVKVCH
ncbi:leukocyte cell-derived chemotaxin 1-like [Branchiostoma floridae]|uniref:Leukocyte cell-derived chemotaxin 1-like n=1 Tax=Branchiostoma floridae TaxID=7739 RepID=A0A9J7NBP0_BRAFL|nr:leukocyte cell-derived chemotaxin 1-like [Branchiostoma floridae]